MPASQPIANLKAFIVTHEGQQVWFLVGIGYIQGTLPHSSLDQFSEPFLILNAVLKLQHREIQIDNVLLNLKQIYAWGTGEPPAPTGKD